ncbi:hypothetical protein D3C86_2028990 [compost metagenome]
MQAPSRPRATLSSMDSRASFSVIQMPCSSSGPKPCRSRTGRPRECRRSFTMEHLFGKARRVPGRH